MNPENTEQSFTKDWGKTPVIVIILATLTGIIRIWNVEKNSISQDESTMILFAKGVLERGYPFLHQAGTDFIISTYEIIPYPIAFSLALFGFSETSARIPAVIFSMLTTVFIFHFGRRLFNARTGMLAATLYSILPWAIYWGRNNFYPAQLQFFALLSIMSVYRMLSADKPSPWQYYSILVYFTLTYLSWEGSGILLPAFFITAITLNWGRWGWLKSPHALITGLSIILVVVSQLTFRTLLRAPFTIVGSSRSDVSFLNLSFQNTEFDPLFYFRMLLTEAHILPFMLFLLGFVFIRNFWNLRYIYSLILWSVLLFSCFLGYFALRYIYFLLPLLLLAIAATVDIMVNWLSSQSVQNAKRLNVGLFGAFVCVVLVTSSPWGIKPTNISDMLKTEKSKEVEFDLKGFSFRSVNQAFQRLYKKGDITIVQAPFPTRVYTDLTSNYFLQAETFTPVAYKTQSMPYYTDRWVGSPVIRDVAQFNEILEKNARVWLLASPEGATRQSAGDEIYQKILQKMCVVTETDDGLLLLWENPSLVIPSTC